MKLIIYFLCGSWPPFRNIPCLVNKQLAHQITATSCVFYSHRKCWKTNLCCDFATTAVLRQKTKQSFSAASRCCSTTTYGGWQWTRRRTRISRGNTSSTQVIWREHCCTKCNSAKPYGHHAPSPGQTTKHISVHHGDTDNISSSEDPQMGKEWTQLWHVYSLSGYMVIPSYFWRTNTV